MTVRQAFIASDSSWQHWRSASVRDCWRPSYSTATCRTDGKTSSLHLCLLVCLCLYFFLGHNTEFLVKFTSCLLLYCMSHIVWCVHFNSLSNTSLHLTHGLSNLCFVILNRIQCMWIESFCVLISGCMVA